MAALLLSRGAAAEHLAAPRIRLLPRAATLAAP
jgi:hypothetical protein